jgi:type I restriction enzyme, S subunit
MKERITLALVLEPFDERLGTRPEPPVLTLTEKNGFVSQVERFNKRLATDDTSSYRVIRCGDVAFNPYLLWAGAIASNQEWEEAIISPAYPTFHVRAGFDPSFVRWLLGGEPIRARYDLISFGAVPRRRRAKTEDFLAIEVPALPPLAEQKRIASILDAADALRQKRRESIAHIDTLVQSVFLDMFGDPERLGWPTATVETIASEERGAIRTGPFGSQLLHGEFVDEGVRVLGIDNAVANVFQYG